MTLLFYPTAAVALFATLMVITRVHAVHALLYLVVAQLAVALLFFLLGASFAAALEALVYAGAIMVMFIFVIMMLNLGRPTLEQEHAWLPPSIWVGPGALCALLLAELLLALNTSPPLAPHWVEPMAVGRSLFGPYLLAVELASLLLLAALVGAYHLARHYLGQEPERLRRSPLIPTFSPERGEGDVRRLLRQPPPSANRTEDQPPLPPEASQSEKLSSLPPSTSRSEGQPPLPPGEGRGEGQGWGEGETR